MVLNLISGYPFKLAFVSFFKKKTVWWKYHKKSQSKDALNIRVHVFPWTCTCSLSWANTWGEWQAHDIDMSSPFLEIAKIFPGPVSSVPDPPAPSALGQVSLFHFSHSSMCSGDSLQFLRCIFLVTIMLSFSSWAESPSVHFLPGSVW